MKDAVATRLPSWFKFLLYWIAIQAVLGDRTVSGWFEPHVPGVWWRLLFARGLTLLGLLVVSTQTLKSDGLSLTELLRTSRDWRNGLLWGLPAGVLFALVTNGKVAVLQAMTGPISYNAALTADFRQLGEGALAKIGFAISVVLWAPITEGLVFRAYAYASMEKVWGGGARKLAGYVCLSSVGFALIHGVGHPLYYVGYFVSGVLYSLLYLRTRSLLACVAAHGTLNALLAIVNAL